MLYRSRRLRLFVVGLALSAFLAGAVTAFGVVGAFRPQGHTRYAFQGVDENSPTVSTSSSYEDLAGMSVSFNIGADRHANLFITFSVELNGCGPIFGRAIVDSSANIATPGAALLFSHTGGSAEAHGFTWTSTVGSGPHTVKIQWQDYNGCDHAFAGVRSLYVTANIY